MPNILASDACAWWRCEMWVVFNIVLRMCVSWLKNSRVIFRGRIKKIRLVKWNYYKLVVSMVLSEYLCMKQVGCWQNANFCALLHEEYPQHHGHKEDPVVTSWICGAISIRAQSIGNASRPRRLQVTRVWPLAMCSSWRENFRMLKNTSIGGVS